MPVTIGPFTDVPAPGDPVASPWAQEITQFAVDNITIGAVAPTNPNAELWYDTSDTGIALPNTPRGVVGRAVITASMAATAGTFDITGLTVTFTADPSRIYRHTLTTRLSKDGTAALSGLLVADGANAQIQGFNVMLGANEQRSVLMQMIESGLSGTITRKGRCTGAVGSITVQASTSVLGFLLVEDIGGI